MVNDQILNSVIYITIYQIFFIQANFLHILLLPQPWATEIMHAQKVLWISWRKFFDFAIKTAGCWDMIVVNLEILKGRRVSPKLYHKVAQRMVSPEMKTNFTNLTKILVLNRVGLPLFTPSKLLAYQHRDNIWFIFFYSEFPRV